MGILVVSDWGSDTGNLDMHIQDRHPTFTSWWMEINGHFWDTACVIYLITFKLKWDESVILSVFLWKENT